MNTRNTVTPRIFLCLLAILLPLTAGAYEGPNITPIPKDQFPALVFAEVDEGRDLDDRSHLMVATFPGGRPEVHQVMKAHWFGMTQLSDAIFLVGTGESLENGRTWARGFFLVNFLTGEYKLVTESESKANEIRLCCLRSFPERHEAMLYAWGEGVEQDMLMHVDLRTLAVTPRRARPDGAGRVDHFAGNCVKISPDFRRLAVMNQHEIRQPRAWCSLDVIDLETMESTTLDNDICVAVSSASSFRPGHPAFNWIGARTILYRHITTEESGLEQLHVAGEFVWKCVDVRSGTTTEWSRKRAKLMVKSPNMQWDWFTGELRCEDLQVDIDNRRLLPSESCCSVDYSEHTRIRFNDKVVFEGPGGLRAPCRVSYTHKHLAFALRPVTQGGVPVRLYALTETMDKPVQVCEGGSGYHCLTWIEDTTALRAAKSGSASSAEGSAP